MSNGGNVEGMAAAAGGQRAEARRELNCRGMVGGRRKWSSSCERVTLAGKSKDENNRAIKKTR